MREHKFRGIIENTDKFIIGELETDRLLKKASIFGWEYNHFGDDLTRKPYRYPVIYDTVGEWSGITDTHLVEVYEGDIVQREYEGEKINMVVCMHNGCYCTAFTINNNGAFFTTYIPFDFDYIDEIFVLGNIYHNSDMIDFDPIHIFK